METGGLLLLPANPGQDQTGNHPTANLRQYLTGNRTGNLHRHPTGHQTIHPGLDPMVAVAVVALWAVEVVVQWVAVAEEDVNYLYD
jgi:hypothetical protein